ncbi:hypothetical protein [Flavobacterium panici]|uniref:Uncharacterized protein n=1 Tax=Flavobacterium panici TaxID=2654843 RepID=A0A9N8P2G8_9FLAO|nr:hypothetical protein [Flavobacterium panici]CAC9975211.1 hypothetical protein FLAPXU55_02920 [Flavobacterium panici]
MKLSLEALKVKAEATASDELLNLIVGGNASGCHVIAQVGDLIIYQK